MTKKVGDVVLVQRVRSLSESHAAPLEGGPGEAAIVSYVYPSGNVSVCGFKAFGDTFNLLDLPVVDKPTKDTQLPYVGPLYVEPAAADESSK